MYHETRGCVRGRQDAERGAGARQRTHWPNLAQPDEAYSSHAFHLTDSAKRRFTEGHE